MLGDRRHDRRLRSDRAAFGASAGCAPPWPAAGVLRSRDRERSRDRRRRERASIGRGRRWGGASRRWPEPRRIGARRLRPRAFDRRRRRAACWRSPRPRSSRVAAAGGRDAAVAAGAAAATLSPAAAVTLVGALTSLRVRRAWLRVLRVGCFVAPLWLLLRLSGSSLFRLSGLPAAAAVPPPAPASAAPSPSRCRRAARFAVLASACAGRTRLSRRDRLGGCAAATVLRRSAECGGATRGALARASLGPAWLPLRRSRRLLALAGAFRGCPGSTPVEVGFGTWSVFGGRRGNPG